MHNHAKNETNANRTKQMADDNYLKMTALHFDPSVVLFVVRRHAALFPAAVGAILTVGALPPFSQAVLDAAPFKE